MSTPLLHTTVCLNTSIDSHFLSFRHAGALYSCVACCLTLGAEAPLTLTELTFHSKAVVNLLIVDFRNRHDRSSLCPRLCLIAAPTPPPHLCSSRDSGSGFELGYTRLTVSLSLCQSWLTGTMTSLCQTPSTANPCDFIWRGWALYKIIPHASHKRTICRHRLDQSTESRQRKTKVDHTAKGPSLVNYTLTHVAKRLVCQHGGDGTEVAGALIWRAAGGNHPVLAVRQVDRAGRARAHRAGAVVPPAAAQPLIWWRADGIEAIIFTKSLQMVSVTQ